LIVESALRERKRHKEATRGETPCKEGDKEETPSTSQKCGKKPFSKAEQVSSLSHVYLIHLVE
jgi:hypothetical protein